MKHYIGAGNPMHAQFEAKAGYTATHFQWSYDAGVGTVTLNRPDRKNPLTFQSYAELRDLFRALHFATDVKVVVVTGAGGVLPPTSKKVYDRVMVFTSLGSLGSMKNTTGICRASFGFSVCCLKQKHSTFLKCCIAFCGA